MSKRPPPPQVRNIPIANIDRSRNYRIPEPDDAARLESLIESVKTGGQLQDVRVYERGPDQQDKARQEPYILGFGDRRCRALLALGKTTVRAVVFPPASDTEIEQARAIENLHRQDVSPLGKTQAVANLLDAIRRDKSFQGDPYEEAATRLAKSVIWVKDHDYLHRLCKPVRQFAVQVGLPAGHLRELAKLGDLEDQFRLACESVGAQTWQFKASEDDENSSAQQEARERFLQTLTEGGIQRWPLSRLRKQVELLKRSLKVVPWHVHETIEHDGVTLPACTDCPHNSETDRTLFGLESEPDNPRGYCLNASCFESKRKASEAVKVAVFKKIAHRKDQSPETIKRIAPAWLKDNTVVGYVQRQLKKTAEGESSPKPSNKRQAQRHNRDLTEHEQAIIQFVDTLNKWHKRSFASILKGINSDPAHRVGWCLLAGTEAFQRQDSWRIPTVSIHQPEPCTSEPTLTTLPDKAREAIDLAMKGTRNAWVELASWNKQGDPDYREQIGILHPEALIQLATLLDVKIGKAPQWQAPATEAPTSKAATA